MDSPVMPELGVESAGYMITRGNSDRSFREARKDCDARSAAGGCRGPDESSPERPPIDTQEWDVGFEGLPLPPECIPVDGDIKQAEWADPRVPCLTATRTIPAQVANIPPWKVRRE